MQKDAEGEKILAVLSLWKDTNPESLSPGMCPIVALCF